MCLDINGILCSFIPHLRSNLHNKSTDKSKSRKNTVIPRPDLDRFLSLIHIEFDIVFYTSRTKKNAKGILDQLREDSYAVDDLVNDEVCIFHQQNCKKMSNKEFKKDLNKVWAISQDKGGNNYKLEDILMIDDSPDKFDKLQNHIIIFQTLKHDEKESEFVCIQQYDFLKCLIKKMQSRKNEESALQCLESTFIECVDNPYVKRCDSSHQCAEVPSKSHGISGSAGMQDNDLTEDEESIDPNSIANGAKVDTKNIIFGESISSESSITVRKHRKQTNMFDPSGQNDKDKKKDVSNVNKKRSDMTEKRKKNDLKKVTKKRNVVNDNSRSNKKAKLTKSKGAVPTVDTDLTEEYMSKLKEYEKMLELPTITKNCPRKPLHYDLGYFKALRKYVQSKEDISVANRYVKIIIFQFVPLFISVTNFSYRFNENKLKFCVPHVE